MESKSLSKSACLVRESESRGRYCRQRPVIISYPYLCLVSNGDGFGSPCHFRCRKWMQCYGRALRLSPRRDRCVIVAQLFACQISLFLALTTPTCRQRWKAELWGQSHAALFCLLSRIFFSPIIIAITVKAPT